MKKVKPFSIEEIKKKYEMQFLAIEGVEGVGVTEKYGKECIIIYASNDSASLKKKIPSEIGGYPIHIESSGEFRAF